MSDFRPLRYVLIADGSSDRLLAPIIDWTLRMADSKARLEIEPGYVFERKHRSISEVISEVREHYFPDVIFVHRDAENLRWDERAREIPVADDLIPVIPVRMIETWLLCDEKAIRGAADNPNGTAPLDLPRLNDLESVQNSKQVLEDKLRLATELNARRRAKFKVNRAIHRLVELIEDFSPLSALPAFSRFQVDVRRFLENLKSLE